jgi:uncharacterized protein
MIKVNNRKLVSNVEYCDTSWKKARGLMFSSKISDKALVFPFNKPGRYSLHMMFVFYAIDVLFLDSSKKVVEIKENFKPFTVYSPSKLAAYIVELPCGCANSVKLGDKVSFSKSL